MDIRRLADALQRRVALTPTTPAQPSTSNTASPGRATPSEAADTLHPAGRTASRASQATSATLLAPKSTGTSGHSSPASAQTPPYITPLVTRSLSELRPLSRAELQEPALIMAMGRYFAQEHRKTRKAMPPGEAEKPLFLFEDARARLANVKNNKEKCDACALNLGATEATLDALELELAEASPTRVYGDFNHYPGGLSITPHGEIISNPDQRNTGWHSVYEILGRHAFTSRLDHDDLQILADAYAQKIFERKATPEELVHHGKAKYVFDIMYHLYFVDIAFDAPTDGTEKGMAQEQSLHEATDLLERIDADWFWLKQRGVDLERLTRTKRGS